MIKNYDELRNELDTLYGNVNRICVTNDISEIEKRYQLVVNAMFRIYVYRKNVVEDMNIEKIKDS